MRGLCVITAAMFALSACAPVPMNQERAEELCRDEAGLADGVEGSVGVGVGTSGVSGGVGVTVNNRVLSPQSEAEFMAECVARRMSGEPAPATFGIRLGTST